MSGVRITSLQRRILQLIEQDYRGVEPIAVELGISERTVKRSVVSLGRKLGVPLPRMPKRARDLGIEF